LTQPVISYIQTLNLYCPNAISNIDSYTERTFPLAEDFNF